MLKYLSSNHVILDVTFTLQRSTKIEKTTKDKKYNLE